MRSMSKVPKYANQPLLLSRQLELFIVIIIQVYRHKTMKFREDKLNSTVSSYILQWYER